MGMIHKVDYIRRSPGIGDYNALVDAINYLIDKVNEKREVVPMTVSREITDFSFFLWNEVPLPYKNNYIIITPEDATNVFGDYAFTYKETTQINDAIMQWKIVALEIVVTELITEKAKKQEAIFETIETIKDNEPIKVKKKRGKKKKSSWE